jgi:hypothetical protein
MVCDLREGKVYAVAASATNLASLSSDQM